MNKWYDLPEFDNHELVSGFADKATGLKGFVCIHNTNLGPATGGTRYWKYVSDEEGLRDALRLSRAMTYKCALAGVSHGGGKAVIIANQKYPKNKNFLAAYARVINNFGGRYTTGEDVGISEEDIHLLIKKSPYINGRPDKAGDLGPWAALGVFHAMQGALQAVFGSRNFKNKVIGVKGLGKVGLNLSKLIVDNGGRVIGADIDKSAVARALKVIPGLEIVKPEALIEMKLDVYAPCAMGGEFNKQNIKKIRTAIICGGANNQIADEEVDWQIKKRDIVYVPDYVANAGGLIDVAGELRAEGYSRKWVQDKIENIFNTVQRILAAADKRKLTTTQVANEMARKVFLKKIAG